MPTLPLKLLPNLKPSWRLAGAISSATIVIGVTTILFAHATSPMSAFEAETGALANGASPVDNAQASGGRAVKFSSGTASNCPATPRDPAFWPYTSASPWNTPIGSSAQYMVSDAPNWPTSTGNINTSAYSQPIFIASAGDPTVNIYNSANGSLYGRFQIPVAARPSSGSDGHMNVIDPAHANVLSLYAATRDANGDTHSWYPQQNNLRGDGLSGGLRAYGGSQIAGLIRKGEIAAGIHHALVLPKLNS